VTDDTAPVKESLSQFKRRLCNSGSWDEFERRRRALAKELGLTLADATEAVVPSFPPPPGYVPDSLARLERPKPATGKTAATGTPDPSSQDFDKSHFKSLKSVNFRRVVLWVFDNLGVADAQPQDAPSSGAWSLLQFARLSATNQAAFYSGFVTRLLTGTKEDERERAIRDDGRDLDPWFGSWLAVSGPEAPAVLSPGAEDAEGERGVASEDGGAVQKESA
jgi:hypothetical protein